MLSDEHRAILLLFGAIAYFLAVTAIWVCGTTPGGAGAQTLFAPVLTIFQGPLWLGSHRTRQQCNTARPPVVRRHVYRCHTWIWGILFAAAALSPLE
jgi:hypothetical protein